MQLLPQDVVILLKLVMLQQKVGLEYKRTYQRFAQDLFLSNSQVFYSLCRIMRTRLVFRKNDNVVPSMPNLLNFLLHGLPYVFVPEIGGVTRGMPTAWAASPLREHFISSELPPVWPDPHGNERGIAFSPLYKKAPQAALADPALYELLALADALRSGRAREQKMAGQLLTRQLKRYG